MAHTERSKLSPIPPPGSLSSFIGRRDELAALTRVLSGSRLVTLLGPGGCGKTRLAIEVANRVGSRLEDGVAFVDLAPVQDPATVPEAAAAALGASRQASSDIAELIGDAQLLLVVDNAEHLVDAVSSLVTILLLGCTRLGVLVTSREVLGVAGEVSWTVPRLKLPPSDRALGPAELLEFDAIDLFCARAAEHQRGFRLSAQNAEPVVAIARRVDGIPLALELAAARARSMALPEIVSRLGDSFRLLTGGPRSAVDRHRTLAATVDWSHQLLTEDERCLFRRLALFVGSFDLAAVEFVCRGLEPGSREVADVLHRLVDKSLVVAQPRPDGDLRYSLFEPIRQYAQEKLREAGESDLRARHAVHYANVAFEAAADRGDLTARAQRMTAEYDNVRVALDWAAENDDATEAAMISALRWFWIVRGSVREARDAGLSALAKTRCTGEALARLYAETAGWLQRLGQFSQSMPYAEQAARLLNRVDDPGLTSQIYRIRGSGRALAGDVAGAEDDLKRAVDAARGLLGEDRITALNNLAMVHLHYGKLTDALDDVQKMQSELASQDQSPLMPRFLHTDGAVQLAVGRTPRAANRFLEGLRFAARYDNDTAAIPLLQGLACLASSRADPVLCLELVAVAHKYSQLAAMDRRNVGSPTDAAERRSRMALRASIAAEASARGARLDLKGAIERAQDLAQDIPSGPLTARKREIVALVAQGLTNRQIAERMSISERTVDAHLEQARNELGVHNRAQVAAWAIREGLVATEGEDRPRASGE